MPNIKISLIKKIHGDKGMDLYKELIIIEGNVNKALEKLKSN